MSPWLTRATRGPPPERLRWLVLPSLREVFPVPMAGLLGVLVPRAELRQQAGSSAMDRIRLRPCSQKYSILRLNSNGLTRNVAKRA